MLHHQAKWSGDGSGQQEQLTGEAERILKQSQSKIVSHFQPFILTFFFDIVDMLIYRLFQRTMFPEERRSM